MSRTVMSIRVFVACTDECARERTLITEVANMLNSSIGAALGVSLEVCSWHEHVSPSAGNPEDVILTELPVSSWDVLIGILWRRFGSPTGNTYTGSSESDAPKPYSSGTEEEFMTAYNSWKQTGKPRIAFFRRSKLDGPGRLEGEQYQKVEEFFRRFSPTGPNPALYSKYTGPADFEKRLWAYLTKVLLDEYQRSLTSKAEDEILAGVRLPIDEGFLGFFTLDTNEERNRKKREALSQEKQTIRLLAYIGRSYLAHKTARFGPELLQALEGGANFRGLLLNPWTETGLLLSVSEAEQPVPGFNLDDDVVDLSRLNAVKVISESDYYSFNFKPVLKRYEELRRRFGSQVELRLTSHNIPATILLTSSTGFFEPYIAANLRERWRNPLHTFEVQYSSQNRLYANTSAYFDILWKMSQSYEDFLAKEEECKVQLTALYNSAH